MSLKLSFRHMKPRDEVTKRCEALYGKLQRFLDPAAESHMTISVEHADAVVELIVNTRGETHKVREEHDDMRTAIDKLFHTAEIQLRRAKERRRAHRRDVDELDGFDPQITGEENPAEEASP